jgi:hypothetical protein
MPRPKPVTTAPLGEHANQSAAHHLSGDDLDELLSQAGIPKDGRNACAADINLLFGQYDRLLAENKQNEASQAESLRQVRDAARELYTVLAKLPPALRMKVEPDYRAFVEKTRLWRERLGRSL